MKVYRKIAGKIAVISSVGSIPRFNGFIDPSGSQIPVGRESGAMKTAAEEIVIQRGFSLVGSNPINALARNGYAIVRDGAAAVDLLPMATTSARRSLEALLKDNQINPGKATLGFFQQQRQGALAPVAPR